jgi:hypothetical protein
MNKLPVLSIHNLNSDLSLNQTIKLLRTISSPLISKKEPFASGVESLELYDLAVKNKISLLYLQALKKQGKLNKLKMEYDNECTRYSESLDGIEKVLGILDGTNIEYVIFKTIKPYPAIPGDIDILILGDNDAYRRASRILLEFGYKYKREPDNTSPSLPDFVAPEGNVVVDLQEELELNYVIYMDKNKFREHIVKREIAPGLGINTLTSEVDLATVIIHSVTEYLYLLGEFYTFLYSLARMNKKEINDFIAILRANRITTAAKAFVTITVELHKAAYGKIPKKLGYVLDKLGYEKSEAKRLVKNDFKMPHRYSVSTVVKVIFEKMGERRFRRSVQVQIREMVMNPRLTNFMIAQVIELWSREYYLKNVK